MAFSIGKLGSVVSSIASKADLGSAISGINISSLNVNSIDSIKGTIESTLNSKLSSITSELQSSINPGDIESMMSGFDFDSQAAQIQSSLTSGMPDASAIEGMSDSALGDIQSQVDSIMGGMNFSSISYM